AFEAIFGVQRKGVAAGDARQPRNAFRAARRALVDRRLAVGNGLRIAAAIGIAAALALRLRQRRVDRVDQGLWGGGVHRRIILSAALGGSALGSLLHRRAARRGRCRLGSEAGDEVAHFRVHLLAPAAAGEDARVARAFDVVAELARLRDAGGQV